MVGDHPAYHHGDTMAAMTHAAGGDEADLAAGFQAVLDLSMHLVPVVDEGAWTSGLPGADGLGCQPDHSSAY